jgi:hypothetical protein
MIDRLRLPFTRVGGGGDVPGLALGQEALDAG